MKTTILILIATVSIAFAGSVRVTGIVTSVTDTTLLLDVGDPFSAHIIYNNHTGAVTRTLIDIGDLHFNYPAEGQTFTVHDDPCDLFVSWQVSQTQTSHLTLLLFGLTLNSCFPPAEFVVNEWRFFLNGQTSGIFTEIPEVHP